MEIILSSLVLGIFGVIFGALLVIAPLAIWIHVGHMRRTQERMGVELKRVGSALTQILALLQQGRIDATGITCPECGHQFAKPAKPGDVQCPKCQAILSVKEG